MLRDKKSSDTNDGKSRPFALLSVKESEQVIAANDKQYLNENRNENTNDSLLNVFNIVANGVSGFINNIVNTVTHNSDSDYLLALAHPLQVSIDPTVCLIKNKLWANGIKVNLVAQQTVDPNTGDPTVTFNHNLTDPTTFVKTLIRNLVTTSYKDGDVSKPIVLKFITDYIQGPEDNSGNRPNNKTQIKENLKEITKTFNSLYSTYNIEPPTLAASWGLEYSHSDRVGKTLSSVLSSTNTFYDLLEDDAGGNLDTDDVDKALGGKDNRKDIADEDPVQDAKDKIEEKNEELEEQAKEGAEGYKFLENLDKHYFVDNDYNTELGIIGHIYVNLNMLYNLCVSDDLASQDKKEKKEIALYDFIKSVLKKISASTGEMNNLDIFINPDNNIAQIIDINYVDRLNQKEAYEKAFELQVHNLNSIVRSYSLESKIFQEQTSIVAIGAQVGGGALGVDTTTLVAFNKSIRDRIIPIKDAPTSSPQDVENPQLQLDTLTKALSVLYSYTGNLKSGVIEDGSFDTTEAGKYQGALRDLINFFRELGKSKSKNKAILPTVLSIDMDGIGGMIIGNLFKINSDILPKGYRTEENGLGARLGYIVTGIGHSIKENDWVTKVEAQTIILDEPQGMDIPFGELAITDSESGETTLNVTTNAAGTSAVKPISVSKNVSQNLDEIEKACKAQGLTNTYIIKAIKANVLKECGGVPQSENLAAYGNTSNDRIRKIFGTRFASVSEADLTAIKKNTPEFAEYIYGLKSGKTGKSLGNTKQGDGYKFRGRGYIQITGRDLYTRCGKAVGKDFANNPDSMNTSENAAAAAVWYIKESLKVLAPRSDYKLDSKNPQPKDQLEANRLITNCIGGVGLKLSRPSKSAIFNEILAKVDRYSSQLA